MKPSCLVLCLMCAVAQARAVAPTTRDAALHFTRSKDAAGCVGPVELAQRVETYTGPVLVPPSQADTAIEAHVRRTGRSGYSARITLHDARTNATRERVLTHRGADCAGFEKALAFVIATMIDPDLDLALLDGLLAPDVEDPNATLLAELEREPPVPAAIEEPVVAAQSSPGEPQVAPSRARWRPALALGAAMASDLPMPALGPTLGVSLRRAWFEARLGTRALFGLRTMPVAPDRRASSRLLASSVLVGAQGSLAGPFGGSLLVGPDVMVIRMLGRGFETNDAGTLVTWAGRLRGGVFVTLPSSFALDLSGSLRFTGMQRRFVFDQGIDQAVAFETPKRSFGAALSVERRF